MNEFDSSIMIALLPTTDEWCTIELPHLTLVYAGETQDHEPTALNNLANDAIAVAKAVTSIRLKVIGLDVFGDEDKVEVLRLDPTPELLAMRRLVEHWNASKYPFNPHATIGPIGSSKLPLPEYLKFDRVLVEWGNGYLIYPFV